MKKGQLTKIFRVAPVIVLALTTATIVYGATKIIPDEVLNTDLESPMFIKWEGDTISIPTTTDVVSWWKYPTNPYMDGDMLRWYTISYKDQVTAWAVHEEAPDGEVTKLSDGYGTTFETIVSEQDLGNNLIFTEFEATKKSIEDSFE